MDSLGDGQPNRSQKTIQFPLISQGEIVRALFHAVEDTGILPPSQSSQYKETCEWTHERASSSPSHTHPEISTFFCKDLLLPMNIGVYIYKKDSSYPGACHPPPHTHIFLLSLSFFFEGGVYAPLSVLIVCDMLCGYIIRERKEEEAVNTLRTIEYERPAVNRPLLVPFFLLLHIWTWWGTHNVGGW